MRMIALELGVPEFRAVVSLRKIAVPDYPAWSIISKRGRRLDPGRPPGRCSSRHHRGGEQDTRHGAQDPRVGHRHPVQQRRDQTPAAHTQSDAQADPGRDHPAYSEGNLANEIAGPGA